MKNAIMGLALLLLGFISKSWAETAIYLQPTLSLPQAIHHAVNNDPWLKGSELKERALLAESIADGELPDPSLSVGLFNLATDTFDFDQEPMSQFTLGVTQNFPRGDSLELKRQQKHDQSSAYPFLRADRKAQIALKVTLLWLDTFLARQSVNLIKNNRHLFEQLIDVAHANYTSTSGSTRQQDVIRAEFELSRLDDRLSGLWQEHDAAQQALGQWLPAELLKRELPVKLNTNALTYKDLVDKQQMQAHLLKHPRVQALDRNIAVITTGVELVRQQYKPQWGVNVAYAYRENGRGGDDRADFASMAFTVDLPLFTANRQDRRVSAANDRLAAAQTERDLLLRELMAGFQQTSAELRRLDERLTRYQEDLLPQVHDQADVILAAYTADGGNFTEVIRARIAEINTTIVALRLKVQRQKALAKLQYFLAASSVTEPLERELK